MSGTVSSSKDEPVAGKVYCTDDSSMELSPLGKTDIKTFITNATSVEEDVCGAVLRRRHEAQPT